MADNLWDNEYKNCAHGRTDILTMENPIPNWIESKLREFYQFSGRTVYTENTNIGNLRSALRILIEEYGNLSPYTIDEDMIRSIGDLRPNYNRSTLYGYRCMIGKMVDMYTGNNPWSERGRYLVKSRIIPPDIEKKFIELMVSCGQTKVQADRQLTMIEHALDILSKNVPNFNPMDFGLSEILQLGNFKTDISPKYLRMYEYALGRYIWLLTGNDPVRVMHRKIPSNLISDKIQSKIDNGGFKTEIEEFIVWNHERGIKNGTILSYIYKITKILSELDTFMPEGWTLKDIQPNHLIKVRQMSKSIESTLKDSMRVFGMFLKYYDNFAYEKAGMMWNVDIESMHRTWISLDQWKMLYNNAPITTKMILALGGGMGLRRNEIAQLKLSDIDGDMITIHGKGHGEQGKVVVRAMPGGVKTVLDDYLIFRMDILRKWGDVKEDYLLISSHKLCGQPMGTHGVDSAIRTYGKKMGVEMSCHTLRRLYATSLRDANIDLDTIRRMMRHAKLDTTLSHYLNADAKRLESANTSIETLLFA